MKDWYSGNGYLVVFGRNGDKKICESFDLQEWDKLEQYVEQHKEHYNLYISRAVLRERPSRGKRGSADLVLHQTFLSVDLDYGKEGHNRSQYPPTPEDALSLLEFLPEPSAIVSTGNGFLVVWKLSEPADAQTALKAQKAIYSHLSVLAGINNWVVDDTSALTTAVRIPGTYNLKNRENLKLVGIIAENNVSYSIEEFLKFSDDDLQKPTFEFSEKINKEELWSILQHIPNAGLDYNDWLATVWTVQRLLPSEDAAELLDRWGTENWRAHPAPEDAKPSPGLLVRLARNAGYTGPAPASFVGKSVLKEVELPNSIVVSQRYLDVPMPDRKYVLIRSAMGTGKTEYIAKWLRQTGQTNVLAISHRVSLVKQLAERLGLESYFDGERWNVTGKSLAITIHSLDKVSLEQQYDVVIIDEIEQFLQALVNDKNLADQKMYKLATLEYRILNARKVILSDAGLGELTLQFLSLFSDANDCASIDNRYIYTTADRVVTLASPEDILVEAGYEFEEGTKVAIACNTKADADKAELFFAEKYPGAKVIKITSDGKEENIEKLANINELLKDVDVFIYSPSVGTGVSINLEGFVVYGIARNKPTGVGNAQDFLQQLSRIRNPEDRDWIVYLDPARVSASTNPEYYLDFTKLRASAADLRVLRTQNGLWYTSDLDKKYTYLYAVAKAKDAALRNRFAETFLSELARRGVRVQIEEGTLSKDQKIAIRKLLKEKRREQRDQNAEAIANAPDDPETAPGLEKKLAKTKVKLRAKYEVDVTPELVKDDEDGAYSKALRLLAIEDQEFAKYADDREYEGRATPEKSYFQFFAIWARFVLSLFGITEIADGKQIVMSDTAIQTVLANKIIIEAALGITIRSDFEKKPMLFLRTLLDKLGISVQSIQHRQDGRRVRSYSLSGVAKARSYTTGAKSRYEGQKAFLALQSQSVTRLFNIYKIK